MPGRRGGRREPRPPARMAPRPILREWSRVPRCKVRVMLALTRRVGEEVVIGDPARPLGVVRVVEIHGDKVRLAFDFPRETAINRRELADQKLRDQKSDAP